MVTLAHFLKMCTGVYYVCIYIHVNTQTLCVCVYVCVCVCVCPSIHPSIHTLFFCRKVEVRWQILDTGNEDGVLKNINY